MDDQLKILQIKCSALELQRNSALNEGAHFIALGQHANDQLLASIERVRVLEAEVATKQERIGALEIELKAMITPSAPPAVPEAPQSPPEQAGVMIARIQE